MAMFKSRQSSSASPQSGISAGEWLQSRKKDALKSNKTSQKYAFLNDSSSDESFSASQFIRTSNRKEDDDSFETKKKGLVDLDRPKTSHGAPEKKTSVISHSSRGENALARFSNLEKQILSRQNIPTVMSSSDMDLDISSDSEIRREIQNIKKRQQGFTESKHIRPEILKDTYDAPTADESKSDAKRNDARKKSVSFASKLVVSQQSESSVSLDEFLPEQYSSDEVSLDDVLPVSNLHGVMSLDDLQPAEYNANTDMMGLYSVDELLPASEVPSEKDRDGSYSTVDSDSNMFNIHSIEDLVPEPSPLQLPNHKPVDDERKSTEEVPLPAQEKAEEDVDGYSEDFNSDSDDTLKDTESITQDITEEIKTESIVTESIATESIATETISSQTKHSYSESYTDSFESDETRTRSSTPESEKYTKRPTTRNEVSVQTDPLDVLSAPYTKRKFTDSEKTFYKPSQIVNNEALAILSTYSPGVLAVQEMLKQQLTFTRDFVARSERLHEAAADSLVADYQYASIEEARQAINKQRQKLRLPPKYPLS